MPKTLNAMEDVMARIQDILKITHIAGTRTEIVREGRFLPLEENNANRALFDASV